MPGTFGNGPLGGGAAGASPAGTLGSGMFGGGADGGPIGRSDDRLLRLRTRADLGFALVLTGTAATFMCGKYDDDRGGWCDESALLLRDSSVPWSDACWPAALAEREPGLSGARNARDCCSTSSYDGGGCDCVPGGGAGGWYGGSSLSGVVWSEWSDLE